MSAMRDWSAATWCFSSARSRARISRVVLLLESVEPPVELVEVAEHFASKLGDLTGDLVEVTVDLGELASEKLDELFVLGRGHEPWLPPGGDPGQVCPEVDRLCGRGPRHTPSPSGRLNGSRRARAMKVEPSA